MWGESRPATAPARETAAGIAHRDDAKQRTDERPSRISNGSRPRARTTWLVPVAVAGAVVVIVGSAALAARVLGADDGRSGSSAVTADPAGADGPVSSVGADAPAASAGADAPGEAPASSQAPESSATIHPAVVAYCDAVGDYVQNQGAGQVVVNQTYGAALNDAVRRVVKAQGRLTAADFDANGACSDQLQEVYDRWGPNG